MIFWCGKIITLCVLTIYSKVRSSAYYPQGDGQSEVVVRTIKQMISAFVAEAQDDWDEKLDELCFAYNTATHAATRVTPMEAMFHRPIKVPLDIFYKAVELTEAKRDKYEIWI